MRIFHNETEMLRFYALADKLAETEECVYLLQEDRFVVKQAISRETQDEDTPVTLEKLEKNVIDVFDWFPGMIKN